MIKVENIKSYIEENLVLENINAHFKPGTITSISGPSGKGKSLLFSIIAGIKAPDQGEVFFKERSVFNSNFTTLQNIRRRFGIAFQVPAIISNLTVVDNLNLAINIYFKKNQLQEKRKMMRNLLGDFDLLEHVDQRPSMLSRGELYRLALARALVCNPEVLLWDEAFTNIDELYHPMIETLIVEMKKKECAIIFFSNRKHIISKYGDNKYIINKRQLDAYEI